MTPNRQRRDTSTSPQRASNSKQRLSKIVSDDPTHRGELRNINDKIRDYENKIRELMQIRDDSSS